MSQNHKYECTNQSLEVSIHGLRALLDKKAFEPVVGDGLTAAEVQKMIYDAIAASNCGQVSELVGNIQFLPFSSNALPSGWYPCNGTRYALSCIQGEKLDALPSEYKANWEIIIQNDTINVPNLFAVSGPGYFIRAADGVTRAIGKAHAQGDAIRNITGSLESFMFEDFVLKGAAYVTGSHPTAYGTPSGTNTRMRYVGIDASRVVPTADENRPINIGMTPAIYLGV